MLTLKAKYVLFKHQSWPILRYESATVGRYRESSLKLIFNLQILCHKFTCTKD